MESNESALKEKIATRVSEKVQGVLGWPCVVVSLGEPKMPMELFMEDCED